ncbi:MAG: YbaB/EbfC family DNA-binding protein [Pseudonocardia sediminis]
MADDYYISSRDDDPMAALEKEKRRLDDLGGVWKNESTTVVSKDKSFSMAFDGRGDLTDITFNGTKYRTLAPAELANLLVTTLQTGRLESMQKMAATMSDSMPGVDFVGLATGKVDPRAALDALIAPMLGDLESGGSAPRRPAPGRAGWES